ncbi:MAG TPA: hypothetical protein VF600_11355 [Abditibacteriaceae bacterium]
MAGPCHEQEICAANGVTASFQEDRLVGKSRGGSTRRREASRNLRRLLP